MFRSAVARNCLAAGWMGRRFRSWGGVGVAAFLPLTAFFFLFVSSQARADSFSNPGDQYVFGADARITGTLPAPQQSPAISGNIAVWDDERPNAYGAMVDRIFFKQLPEATAPPGAQTPDELQTPCIKPAPPLAAAWWPGNN